MRDESNVAGAIFNGQTTVDEVESRERQIQSD